MRCPPGRGTTQPPCLLSAVSLSFPSHFTLFVWNCFLCKVDLTTVCLHGSARLNQRKHQLRLCPCSFSHSMGSFLKATSSARGPGWGGETCCASRDLSQKDMLSCSQSPHRSANPGLHFYRAEWCCLYALPSFLPGHRTACSGPWGG